MDIFRSDEDHCACASRGAHGEANGVIPQVTRTGRPARDADFTSLVERLTDRDLSAGNPEDLRARRNKSVLCLRITLIVRGV